MRRSCPPPTPPPTPTERTPVTLLASTCVKFVTGMMSCCAATSIVPIEAPILRFSTAPPVPVTTTCCSSTADAAMAKFSFNVSFAAMVTVCASGRKPMRVTRTVRCPVGIPRTKYRPLSSVLAPSEASPTTCTRAPLIGAPEARSVTVPLSMPVPWACASAGVSTAAMANSHVRARDAPGERDLCMGPPMRKESGQNYASTTSSRVRGRSGGTSGAAAPRLVHGRLHTIAVRPRRVNRPRTDFERKG